MNNNSERKSMIKVRGGYSDRSGYNVVCNKIQVEDFDNRTRAILSNEIFKICNIVLDFSCSKALTTTAYNNKQVFLREILSEVFNEINYLNNGIEWKDVFKKIDAVIQNAPLNEVLDIIEFICIWLEGFSESIRENSYDNLYNNEAQDENTLFSYLNAIFERECTGYRFVNGEIIKNIDDTEISAIKEASTTGFDGCNTHIQKATHHLYNRDKPDYKNSIKESISAVESICIIIAGEGATLGDALKVLGKKQKINNQLKVAFEKLYSYTNSEGGIRHAEGMFESDVSFEEAKFMLVSCCAFVNYLIAEYGKIEE